MGRFDYRESHFSMGKFILCLLISVLIVGLAWAVYAISAGILQLIPGIILCAGIITLLVLVSLILKNYNYSWQGPSFIGVFFSVILIAGIASLVNGIGPLSAVKESIFASFKSTPMQVVQMPAATAPQGSLTNTSASNPSGDKVITAPSLPSTTPPPSTTTPAAPIAAPSTTPALSTPPLSGVIIIPVSPMPGGVKGSAGVPSATTQNLPAPSSTPTAAIDALEKALNAEVNALRQISGLKNLEKIAFLDGFAREHSQYMLEHGQISHDGFSTDRAPTIISTVNVSRVGENVLYVSVNLLDIQQIADVWYQSPDHRVNMLTSEFRRTGIGIVIGNGRIYATQIFTD